MTWIGWLLVVGFVAWPLGWLLQPWRWAAFKALVTHPPLGPFEPPWWWVARLMRFGYLAWRLLIAIQVLFLSAMIAVGIDAESSNHQVQSWFDDGWQLAFQLMAFLWLGFAFDLAIHVWRITRQPEWPFTRRHLTDLFFPAAILGLVLMALWSFATTGPHT